MAVSRRLKEVSLGCGGLMIVSTLLCAAALGPCWSAWLRHGMWVDHCPAGNVVPTAGISAYDLGRGRQGTVNVSALANYWNPRWNAADSAALGRFDAALFLVDDAGKEIPLEPADDEESYSRGSLSIPVDLPAVPDGDYTLRARLDTSAGEAVVDAPLKLYEPALAHVLTDVPLYKPGQVLRFRGVLLGQAELRPLDGRPLVWKVFDPSGGLVLEEKARTGAFGVADSNLPLDASAPTGTWKVVLESGAARDEVEVTVKPFQLPRFTVSAQSSQSWWRMGESPEVVATARYSSGAPVADAEVTVTVRQVAGRWPAPLPWLEPRTLRTDKNGRVVVPIAIGEIGAVPFDLVDQVDLSVSIAVADAGGDQEAGGAVVHLSEHGVLVNAVTELEDGLVVGANNRVFLRVTRPDGSPVVGEPVRLRRSWDPDDPGVEAVTDADAVARFQIDPGRPVTVTEKAVPIRHAEDAMPPAAELATAEQVPDGDPLSIADRSAIDVWTRAIGRCAGVLPENTDQTVSIVVVLEPGGQVSEALLPDQDDLGAPERCVAETLRGQRGPSGGVRVWQLVWDLHDQRTPWIDLDVGAIVGDAAPVEAAIAVAQGKARACVGRELEPLALPERLYFRVNKGSRTLSWRRASLSDTEGVVSASVFDCVARALTSVSLDEPVEADILGYVDGAVEVHATSAVAMTSPTTWPGFAFSISAGTGESTETGVLRMREGNLPNLRLRFSETVVQAGATVELSALRGPNFSGTFPDELVLRQGSVEVVKFKFDPEKRVGSFTLPPGVDGFMHVEWYGARAILYVEPESTLAVAVVPDAEAYRPGSTATLAVRTSGKSGPVAAGVTLVGVDSTLGALATLPGADDFARTTVLAKSSSPAFGALDARALQTGQIQGQNAAQATVLRLSELPPTPERRESVATNGQGSFDARGPLADAFYEVYTSARAKVRAWEAKAPAGEHLTARIVMDLWDEALDETQAVDAFGRPLALKDLPADLLTLCDPRYIVGDTTRLPEDVENWAAFVLKES